MTFLLQSDRHFFINQEGIGVANSKVLFSACAMSLIFTPATGYLFDLFGRRIPLLIALLGSILLTFLIPHTAPSFPWLCFVRSLIGLCNTILMGSPLIADYVKKESRGRAVALATVGMLVGEVFSVVVLVNLTAGMDI